MPQDRLLHPKASRSQKVTSLTDFEYRVWTQYLLSADDFGVMRHSGVTLQRDNDALDAKPKKVVQRALDQLVRIGLIGTFEHQGRTYSYQRDWQMWQKVEYPRATLEPKPPAETLDLCETSTVDLFTKHPGGTRQRNTKDAPKDSGRAFQISSEDDPSNARARVRETANANGIRPTQTANGIRPSAIAPSAQPPKQAPINDGFRRLKVWRWMIDDWTDRLGPHAASLCIIDWLHELDERDDDIPPRDPWVWLDSEFMAEVRRRGLPVAQAAHLGKQTTNLMAAVSNLSDRR